MDFKGRVVVITGAGIGLGRDYALFFGSRGAKVVVNDLGVSTKGEGNNSKVADQVVAEIKSKGGEATANYDSVEFGEKIIKTAMDAYGRVDVLINNAGILRDKVFKNITPEDWNLIVKVHLNGVYACTKAAWEVMLKQKFGRIITVSSPSGLYGSFGQANYAMAKAGMVGFTRTLAMEGEKYNIRTNCIAPVALTRMTENLFPEDIKELLKVEYITPLVAFLSHESCTENGSIYEVQGTLVTKVRWQRSQGVFFGPKISMEDVAKRINDINDFGKENTYQDEDQKAMSLVVNMFDEYKQKNKTMSKF